MSTEPIEDPGEDDNNEDEDERSYIKPLYCKTVKVPASNFIRTRPSGKIEILVKNSSRVISQAHLLIKAFTLYEYKNTNTITYPDDKLCSYGMSLIGRIARSSKIAVRQRLKKYFDEYFENLLNPKRAKLDGYCNIFVNASEQMETSYMNNIIKMYPNYLKKLITTILNGPEPVPEHGKLTHSEITARKEVKKINRLKMAHIYKAVIIKDSTGLEADEKRVFDICIKEFVPKHTLMKAAKTETDEEERVPNIPYDIKCKKQYRNYLFYMIKINAFFEENSIRLYQPLSLSNSDIPRHINLQATTFINTFDKSYLGYSGQSSRHILNSIKKSHENGVQNMWNLWNKIVNMHHPVFKQFYKDGKGLVFYNTINTDGVACSITFAKFPNAAEAAMNAMQKKVYVKTLLNPNEPKYVTELLTKEKELIKDWVTIAVDPGKKDLAHFIDDSKDNEDLVKERREKKNKATQNNSIFSERKKMHQKDVLFKYSNNRRREEAFFNKTEKTRLKIRRQPINKKNGPSVIDLEQELSNFSSRTTNYDRFMEFVVKKLEVSSQVRRIYQLKTFRKMKLRCFINARKSIDNMMNQVYDIYGNGEEPIVLAYGDWGAKNQLRGCVSSLGKGLRNKFVKRPEQFKVVLVDEYRTSKMCNECGKELKNKTLRYRPNEVKKNFWTKKIHRVFICKECCDRECSNKAICRYTNRDVNGSKNILKAYWSEFRTGERPEYLKRGQPAPQERAGGPGGIRKRGKKLSEPTTQALNEKIV